MAAPRPTASLGPDVPEDTDTSHTQNPSLATPPASSSPVTTSPKRIDLSALEVSEVDVWMEEEAEEVKVGEDIDENRIQAVAVPGDSVVAGETEKANGVHEDVTQEGEIVQAGQDSESGFPQQCPPPATAYNDADANEDSEAADTYNPILSSPTYTNTKSGHFSTMSFARTAQEVNFDDEESSEWSVTRQSTDLLKFMPEKDRSNSFPVVPPAPEHKRAAESISLSRSEGPVDAGEWDTPHARHEALWDIEGGEDIDGWGVEMADGQAGPGNIDDNNLEGGESRFEEGLPLIRRRDVPETPVIEKAVEEAFGGGEGAEFVPRDLRRKSTMQAMGNVHGGDFGMGLDGVQEEEDEKKARDDLFGDSGDVDDFFDKKAAGVEEAQGQGQQEAVATPTEPAQTETAEPVSTSVQDVPVSSPAPAPEPMAAPVPPSAAPAPAPTSIPEQTQQPTTEVDFFGDSTDTDDFFDKKETEPAAKAAPAPAPAPATESSASEKHKDVIAAKWEEVFGSDDEEFLEDLTSPAPATDAISPTPAAQNAPPIPVVATEGFMLSDDDSLLDDDDDNEVTAPAAPTITASAPTSTLNVPAANRYASSVGQPSPNPYASASPYYPPASPNPFMPAVTTSYGNVPPPPLAELKRVDSFVDKKKGYQSPYDLPIDLKPVAPRKRPAMQTIIPRPNANPLQPPPVSTPGAGPPPIGLLPRSSSMNSAHSNPNSTLSLPTPSAGPVPAPRDGSSAAPPPISGAPAPGRPPLKSRGSGFFEELPVHSKPRLASRAPSVRAASPALNSGYFPAQSSPLGPLGPPPGPAPLQLPYVPVPPIQQAPPPTSAPSGNKPPGHGLVAPGPVNPYVPTSAPVNSYAPTSAPAPVNPYALQPLATTTAAPKAPGHGLVSLGSVNPYAPQAPTSAPIPTPNKYAGPPAPASVGNRYSPAPSGSRPSSSYAPGPPSVLQHQPRTSSPLAYFETADGESGERRASHYERGSNKTPSHAGDSVRSPISPPQRMTSHDSRYAAGPLSAARSTPPPPGQNHVPRPPSAQTTLSPPKRANVNFSGYADPSSPRNHYVAQSPDCRPSAISHYGGVPPPAAPGQAAILAPTGADYAQPPTVQPSTRPRAPSIKVNMVPPTDGRELDPLERWKGSPIVTWSPSGSIVTSFPKSVPRYTASSSVPMVMRMTGEVKVQHVKDLVPMDERLVRFPGPLKSKGKKKEVIAWLSTGIDALEKETPAVAEQVVDGGWSFDQHRATERVLLWKTLRLLVEFDGKLDGLPVINKAVQNVLMPGLADQQMVETAADVLDTSQAAYMMGGGIGGATADAAAADYSGVFGVTGDAVDAAVIERIKRFLAVGDQEKAAWAAADKRLWGHALLIANAAGPELYQKVTQEFVRKEVNFPGHKNESLAALYAVLTGNAAECVDELVPSHARAGLNLIAATPDVSAGPDSAAAGLNKWRETLAMIMRNRTRDDADMRALVALGNLLAEYGRIEAAHVCFLFSHGRAVFGGVDDLRTNFVLIGADHRSPRAHLAHDTEALLLSEIAEYAYGLSASSAGAGIVPHLSAYKLQFATTLAEVGQRDKAMAYCDTIIANIAAQTRRSPYHHPILETAVDDLQKRLKSAPRDGDSKSWIAKPNMGKVSSTIWGAFNNFVSGEDADNDTASGSEHGTDQGPFGHIPAGSTPTISRSPSVANFNDGGYGASVGASGGHVIGPNLGGVNAAFSGGLTLKPSPAADMQIPGPAPSTRPSSRYTPSPMMSSSVPMSNPYAPVPMSSSAPAPSNPYAPVPLAVPSADVPMKTPSEYATPGNSYAPSFPEQQSEYGSSRGASYDASPANPSTKANSSSALKSPIDLRSGQSFGPIGDLGVGQASSAPSTVGPPPPPSYGGFKPPSMTPEAPKDQEEDNANSGYRGFEPSSLTPYTPYVLEPDSSEEEGENGKKKKEKLKKKKGYLDLDDDDDIPGLGSGPIAKDEEPKASREPDDLVKKIAEEEAKRDAEAKTANASNGWFGWLSKKSNPAPGSPEPRKATKANLGEESSFYFDPDKQKWVNRNAPVEEETKKPPPPPPRAVSATHGNLGPAPAVRSGSVPPLPRSSSMVSLSGGSPGGGLGSRPGTSMSNADSLDELMVPVVRGKKGKKKGGTARYVATPGL